MPGVNSMDQILGIGGGGEAGIVNGNFAAGIPGLEISENRSSQKDLAGSLTHPQRKLRKEGRMAELGEGGD